MRAAVLACVTGVLLLQHVAVLPSLQWLWGLPLWVAIVWILPTHGYWQILRRAGVLILCAALGFAWAQWRADVRLADSLPLAWSGVDMTVVGVVADLPVHDARGDRFSFDIERVLTPGAHAPLHITLTRYASAGEVPVQPGQRWQWAVRLNRPHASQNAHVLDMESVWFANGIRAMGSVRVQPPPQLLTTRVMQPGYWVDTLRLAIDTRIDHVMGNAPYAGVIKALTVGDQSTIPAAQWQLYQRTGIIHLISISGSHVTLLAGLIAALAQWLWRRNAAWVLLLPAQQMAALTGAITALLYVALAGFGIPAQRTLVMLWVVAWAVWSRRQLASTHVLALALLAVTLFDPWAVLAPGFWLSFGAVGLLLFATGARVGNTHWLMAWWRPQWAVTLGLAPVLLLLFGQLSTVSPVANAVAIPVVELLVTPLSLLGCVPGMDWALQGAHRLLVALMWLMRQLGRWPVWQQVPPSTLATALALGGVLWILLPRGVPSRWLGLVWMMPALLTPAPHPAYGGLWVDTLDVGQGLAVVLRTAHHAWLFDAGPRYTGGDSGARIIVPWLHGEGINRLDGMVLSHDDSDHTGGAQSVLAALPVGYVLTPLPKQHVIFNAYTQAIIRCVTGEQWQQDGVQFTVLHPDEPSYADATLKDNHRSCALKIDSAGGSALLSADIEAPDEAQMLTHTTLPLASMLLIAPHHGSRTSSTPDFIATVHPKWVVFTVGAHNRFGHPHGDVVARYRHAGVVCWRSDRNGQVSVHFAPQQPAVLEAWRQTHRRYWMDE